VIPAIVATNLRRQPTRLIGAAQQHDTSGSVLGDFRGRGGEVADHFAAGCAQYFRPIHQNFENGVVPPQFFRWAWFGSRRASVYDAGAFGERITWLTRSCAAAACSTSRPEPPTPPMS
jgi:hypothetical protein